MANEAEFMMKQVVQAIRTGKTEVIEVPVPKPGPGMALVKTAASVVSAGTERALVTFSGMSLIGKARSRPDLVRQVLDKVRKEGLLTTFEAVQNRLDQPMPLGYASSGTVVAVGEGIEGFRVGDRVVCGGGGYAIHAEYAVVPQNLLAHLPDTLSFESGATATLGAIALHGFRLAEPQVGDRVAVIGLGLLGLLACQVAKAAGCSVFGVDLSPTRVQLAQQMGVEAVIREDAETAAATFSRGSGFDVVLICADTSSDDPVTLAGAMARDRGRIIVIGAVGMTIPRKIYYRKELSLIVSRSYGPGRYDPLYEEAGLDYPVGYVRWTEGRNLAAFVDLLAEAQIDLQALFTHRIPIERATEAYEVVQGEMKESSVGVLITYPDVIPDAETRSRRIDLRPRSVKASEKIRLGVIGAGNFATAVLLPALRKVRNIEFVGLATATGMKSAHVGQRYGFLYATTEESELLEDERINTIAVLTRHHLHAQQVIRSLRAGKHVYCEKPLALTSDELKQIADALQESDGLLTVGFNRRFAPFTVALKAFLEGVMEPLAMTYRINAGFLPHNHWLHDPLQGGGRIIGEACHFIDYLTFLAAEPPISVQAHGLPDEDRYREDNVFLSLSFPGGSVGTVAYFAGGDQASPKERIEVFGGGRVAVLDNFRRLEMFQEGRRRVSRAWLRQDKGFRGEWETFVASIARGGPPPIPYDHLFAVTQASFAAVDSLRSRNTVPIEPLSPI